MSKKSPHPPVQQSSKTTLLKSGTEGVPKRHACSVAVHNSLYLDVTPNHRSGCSAEPFNGDRTHVPYRHGRFWRANAFVLTTIQSTCRSVRPVGCAERKCIPPTRAQLTSLFYILAGDQRQSSDRKQSDIVINRIVLSRKNLQEFFRGKEKLYQHAKKQTNVKTKLEYEYKQK